MMNYEELASLLAKVADATRSLSRFEAHFDKSSWGVNMPLLQANAEAESLLKQKRPNADWIDKATGFLMKELAMTTEGFAFRKVRTFPYSVQTGDRKNLENSLEALRKLLDQEQLRHRLPPKQISCLVLTALPVEFRAFIRHASQIGEPSDLQGFSCAFNPEHDKASERQRVEIECVVNNGNANARVRVHLPKRRASLSAQQEISATVHKNGLDFAHLVVVGIAGHLDETRTFGICDVVISNHIYDSHDRRVREAEIDFSGKRLFSFDVPCGLTLDGWRPRTTCESRPDGEYEFRKAGKGHIVSGPESVAQTQWKAKLQAAFPNCVAVEMEAAGCCWAVEEHKVPVTVVKSICDWSNETKTKHYQRYCADLAAHLAIDYICDLYGSTAN